MVREVEILGKLKGASGIPKVLDHNISAAEEKPFVVLEWIDRIPLPGNPLNYPGAELARQARAGSGVEWQHQNVGNQWLLPHINELHRDLPEQHVFEDIMQLIDWITEGKASLVTPAHAAHITYLT